MFHGIKKPLAKGKYYCNDAFGTITALLAFPPEKTATTRILLIRKHELKFKILTNVIKI